MDRRRLQLLRELLQPPRDVSRTCHTRREVCYARLERDRDDNPSEPVSLPYTSPLRLNDRVGLLALTECDVMGS